MSKKANPTTIGSFVIGAVFLAIAGILIFSKSELFTREDTYVCYFAGSLTGLEEGAAVSFRGIRVGTVKKMEGIIDPDTLEIETPVYVSLRRGAMRLTRELTEKEDEHTEILFQRMVERGLRAKLHKDSFVTGQLHVALDFIPDAPLQPARPGEFPEIPTVKEGLAKLTENIGEIDFAELVKSATSALKSIDGLMASPEIPELIRSLTVVIENPEIGEIIHNVNVLIQDIHAQVEPLSASSRTVLVHADELLTRVEAMLTGANKELERITDAAVTALESINKIEGDYMVAHKTTALIEDAAAAARSIRDLAEYLERHPEALLRGKN